MGPCGTKVTSCRIKNGMQNVENLSCFKTGDLESSKEALIIMSQGNITARSGGGNWTQRNLHFEIALWKWPEKRED